MVIGEIFLGSFFQVLLDKLVSMGLDYARQERNNATLLHECEGMLETINAVLDDAEDKQVDGDRLVKLWLDDVKDLAYDMEDLLDEFEIEAAQTKLEAESSTSRGQVKRKLSFFRRSCSLVFETRLQEIKGRLEGIVKRKALLSLTENVVARSPYTNKRLPSTSLLEPEFFGRDKEKAEILTVLTGEAKNADSALSIVSIVGMGGVGKTTLAQQLYNDAKASSYFERKAWVCVSNVFDVLNITKTILQSITEESYKDNNNLDKLQVKLKDHLSEKKLLVVLDDVWHVKYLEWTTLLKPLKVGAKGSKIIVTTRNLHVVSIIGDLSYPLEVLSTNNLTALLAYHALGTRHIERHPNLATIGKKIAEKCRGLPLAAKVLGGLLRNKVNPKEWEAILNNRTWDITIAENDEVLPALKLSYLHLPSCLKRCFAYCAVFPKDYKFERDELALLWIAEGFLDEQKEKESILRLGRNYFNELVSRSFFQQSSVNKSKFSMHDLLNDLAKSIMGLTCFTSGESQVMSNEDAASFKKKARYASFVSEVVTSKSSEAYAEMKVLRSFMLLIVQFNYFRNSIHISEKVLHDLLRNLKYLRVLSLCHCSIIEVPNCVGDLKHLRYLNLSYTQIKRLPESIGALCKLQALILRDCWSLSVLPPNITNLVNLQFLDIRNTTGLKEMPLGISNLKNLIILSKFVVEPEKGSQLKELKNLPHLQGELLLSKLQKVEEVRDAIDAINAIREQSLSKLILLWDKDFGNRQNYECEAQVLQSLQPHIDLENLTIWYYGGGKFPSWLGDPSYSNIVSLHLHGCPKVTLLPSLGQLPSLRELSLEGLSAVSTIGSEFYGTRRPFPSLTTLTFEEMSAWKNWSLYVNGQEVPFSCLQYLVVRRCPELTRTLPRQLGHLIKLEIHSCLHLTNSTSAVRLPSLCELHIRDCNKEILKWLNDLTSLTILKIGNLAEFVCFDSGFMSYLVKLKELHISSCDKLTYLWPDGEIELPCNLERMKLYRCSNLERLPRKMHSLRHLSIQYCPKIMGLIIPPYDSSSNNILSPLEYLQISWCDSWIFSLFAKDGLATLKTLIISNCKGVESLEGISGVEMLESLTIDRCNNLGSLLQDIHTLAHLTRLSISDCQALEIEDFPPLPSTLSSLSLSNCSKIKSIANCNIANCNNLTSLEIKELGIEEFPPLPITLMDLELRGCPKVKSLPNEWHHLTSLQRLCIERCENIKCFPEGGLPPHLQSFYISLCHKMEQPVREWGLPSLASLESLIIDRCSMGGEGDKELFPSVEDEEANAWSLLFPSSLIFLRLDNMGKVKRLSNGLRHHLSSLQGLSIFHSWMLRDLPEDGFPPSLHRLGICGSSILEDRCSELTGDYWPLIQDIPWFMIINGDRIH